MTFKEVASRYDGPALETEVLAFWRSHNTFEKTLRQTRNGPQFSFNEGPPTANGKPGIHHVLARSFKDVFPRYKTMQGYFVPRKAGWDTHGLPVEHESRKTAEEGRPHRQLRQGGNRGKGWHYRVHAAMSRIGYDLHRRLGEDDRANGLLG